MKFSLSENISKLRREHGMTQERLAEALGVTFASVSKWERGLATPELSLITGMADLFGVSLDALIGFEVQNGSAAALEKRIHDLQLDKNYPDAIAEAEKALFRYPNDFRLICRSGELYTVAGIEMGNNAYLRRGIELLEQSILLLSQNTDPGISEFSIQNEIAQNYIVLGETKKGVELLKKYNVSGVHDALIAIAMTGNDITHTTTPEYNIDEALPFMTDAFGSVITNALRTMMAYANYFYKKNDPASGRDALLWLIHLYEGLRVDKNKTCYLDKVIAPSYSQCANFSLMLGERENAENYLRRAYNAARLYDNAPTCRFDNIRFIIDDAKNATAYDDLGDTAMAAVLEQIGRGDHAEELTKLWDKIVNEKIRGNAE